VITGAPGCEDAALQLGDVVRGRVVQTEMSFVAEEDPWLP
jgi:hypothetical protein